MAEINEEGIQHYGVGIDIDTHEAAREVDRVNRQFDQLGKTALNAGADIESSLKKIGAGVAAYFAVGQIKSFASEIVNVRKEFQSLEISFSTLLGSAEKGKKMFQDITNFATSTPMLEKDLAKAAQTMLGFNIESEKVLPLLQQLGDISMGDSQKFQSLSLAFSQASSTGKLMGQDLLQMINAGFNPLVEISRTTGKSVAELKDEMSEGKITVEMLEGALKSATSEGGKFNGMLESMSHTMEGAFSNLEGAVQKFMNDMGQELEGPVIEATTKATDAVNWLAENTQTLVRYIGDAIVMFGSYKAACLVAAAANKVAAASAMGYSLQTQIMRKQVLLAQAAQALLNKTMLANPYVIAGVALGALITSMINYSHRVHTAEEATKKFNEEQEEAKRKEEEHKQKINELIDVCKDETLSEYKRQTALAELKKAYPSIFAKYDTEKMKLEDIVKLKERIAELDVQRANATLDDNINNAIAEEKRLQRNNNTETENKLDAAKQRTNLLLHQKSDKVISQYTEALKKLKPEELDRHVKELQSKIDQRKGQVGDYYRFWLPLGNGKQTDTIALTKSEIQSLISTVRTTKNNIINPPHKETVGEERSKLKSDLEKAKREYESTLNNNNATAEDLRKKRETYETAKKAWDDSAYGKSEKERQKENTGKTAAQRQSEVLAQQDAENELLKKQYTERERQQQDMMHRLVQQQIDLMKEGEEKVLAQMRLNADKELLELDREEEDAIQAEIARQKAVFDAREEELAKKNDKYAKKVFSDSDIDQQSIRDLQEVYQSLRENVMAKDQKAQSDYDKTRKAGLYEFLKVYGSIEEQRAAINAEYNEKILHAENDVQKARLELERQEANKALDFKQFQQTIDWDTVFNDLDKVSTEYLNDLKVKLKEALDGKDVTAENAKVLAEKIREIENTIRDRGSFVEALLPGLRERKRLIEETVVAQNELNDAVERQRQAQESVNQTKSDILNVATLSGSTADISSFNDVTLDMKSAIMDGITDETVIKALNDLFAKLGVETSNLNVASTDVEKKTSGKERLDAMLKAVGGKGKFDIKDLLGGADTNSFLGIAGLIGKNMNGLNELTKSLGLHDTEFGKAVEGFNEGTQHFMGAIQSLLTGDVFGALAGVVNGFVSWGTTIGNIFGLGADDNGYADMMERYEQMSKYWDELLEKKKAYINESYGHEATKAKDEALSIIKNDIEQQRLLAKTYAGGGASIGSHSYGYRFNRSTGYDWGTINSMTAEQLRDFREKVGAQWALWDTDFTSHWDKIIESADKVKEVEEAWRERLTGISAEGFKDDFISKLMDMDASFTDFTKDMTEKLTQAMLKAQIDKILGKQLDSYYEKWSNYMEDGTLTDAERSELQTMYDAIVEKGREIQQNVAEITGYNKSSSTAQATTSSVMSVTEDTANDLVGRETAVQIAVEGLRLTSLGISDKIDVANRYLSDTVSLIDANRELTSRCASWLEVIAGHTAYLPSMDNKLQRIIDNTN